MLVFFLGLSSALAGWGLPTLWAGLIWFSIIIAVDLVVMYKTRDVWLWPVVRMIEYNWYGRTLDKEGTTEAERKAWRAKNRFMLGEKENVKRTREHKISNKKSHTRPKSNE